MTVTSGQLSSFAQVLGGPGWAVGTDILVRVDQLRDRNSPKQYVNDAAVTGQMTDSAGAPVGGEVTFVYVSGSNGRYHGTVPNSLALTAGSQYTFTVTIVSGSLTGVKKITRRAKYDTRAA